MRLQGRRCDRPSKRWVKDNMEREWKTIKATHEIAMQTWEAECARLAEQQAHKSTWPKKPKRPLKPRAPPMVRDWGGMDSEEDDDGDKSD